MYVNVCCLAGHVYLKIVPTNGGIALDVLVNEGNIPQKESQSWFPATFRTR
jgi:hypothetical protein